MSEKHPIPDGVSSWSEGKHHPVDVWIAPIIVTATSMGLARFVEGRKPYQCKPYSRRLTTEAAWVFVMPFLGCGKTVAHCWCEAHGIDPDMKVRPL